MTPHMQSSAAKSSSYRKTNGKKHMSGDREQGSLSVELWKKAFKDACERLCPVRAAGHECACLSVLARLVFIVYIKLLINSYSYSFGFLLTFYSLCR